MRVWHNFHPVGDIVEYIEGEMYGVVDYNEGKRELGNHNWLYTMLSHEDVEMYLDWCWRECDRLIYNVYERKEGDKEWLPGDELNDPEDED